MHDGTDDSLINNEDIVYDDDPEQLLILARHIFDTYCTVQQWYRACRLTMSSIAL